MAPRTRANVVLELINSERDYVKHLRDMVEGYLYPARRHPEIFTGERINTIFANIEQLYEFQRQFLDSLEKCINWQDLAASEVGKCFLDYEKGFSVYHYYCNNHPNATSELQDLYTKPSFVKFFEACRLLQNMIDISLDGFLLTPIQKICKYPLQLTELLKNTDESHADFGNVTNALETMRNCANLANERKRRIEALADIMLFQTKVEAWFGPKLSDTSSVLVHSGEVLKINSSNAWYQGVQLYLFDHLLLFLKKETLLTRSSLTLRGRICMDTVTEICDADEYKARRSFKLFCGEQQKWFVFITKTEEDKDEWIQAFERERNLVELDESEGFQITEREIGIAKRALHHRKHSRSARYGHNKRPDTAIVDQIDLDDANMIMNRTLSLPSCIHPSHVMNFVEDSRVLEQQEPRSGSKTSVNQQQVSPGVAGRSASGRRLNRDQQQQQQQQQQQAAALLADDELEQKQTGGGNWFRKMGSKKLSKSQLYIINGDQTGGSAKSKAHSPLSSSPLVAELAISGARNSQAAQLTGAQTISSDKAAIKYEELEKRHREHMSSEQQARLYRLNNELPPPAAILGPSSAPAAGQQVSLAGRQPGQRPEPPARLHQQSRRAGQQQQQQQQQRLLHELERKAAERAPDSQPTFETTLVLSSGRVVKVREDAV